MTENKIIKYFVYKGTGGLFHNLKGLSKAIKLSILNIYQAQLYKS